MNDIIKQIQNLPPVAQIGIVAVLVFFLVFFLVTFFVWQKDAVE